MNAQWQVRELQERDTIRGYLDTDRIYAAYALGDLEPSLFRHCRWWLAEVTYSSLEKPWALLLDFGGLTPHAAVCLGEPDGVGFLLADAPLPAEIYLVCRPEHLPPASRTLSLGTPRQMARMVLDSDRFRPIAPSNALWLTWERLQDLQALYAMDPGSGDAFAPYQLADGVYYGIEVDGALVSVAGTHLVAPTERIGAIGNVLTHPAHRGQGYAAACTSAVCAELLARGLTVVLNVATHNAPALRLYQRLGFREHCLYYEVIGTRIHEELTDDKA